MHTHTHTQVNGTDNGTNNGTDNVSTRQRDRQACVGCLSVVKGRIGVCRDRMAPMVSAASRSIVELDRKYKRMQRPVELQAHAYAVIINFM